MNEERQTEHSSERHTERDSQLSAMFDGELPGAECELLARRLARDEGLRAQWSRYALAGAALRAERGVKLHDRVATRVQSAVASEPVYGEAESASQEIQSPHVQSQRPAAAGGASRSRWNRLAAPLGGMGIAAGVAALSIFALRNQGDEAALVAAAAPAAVVQVAPEGVAEAAAAATSAPSRVAAVPSSGEPERYVTPSPSSSSSIAPPARLANYVVAHSEYSSPLSRRLALLGLVSNESQPADAANVETAPVVEAPARERARAAGAGNGQ